MLKILISTSILLSLNLYAQLSTTNIDFNYYVDDTNNDLKNHFIPTNDYTLFQGENDNYIQTPLQGTPLRPLKLCYKFQGIDTETMKISIDFKREDYPTPISSNSAATSVGIFIVDNSNVSILSTYIADRNKLFIGGLNNSSDIYSSTLDSYKYLNNHWYRMIFEISKISESKYSITSSILSLGISGKDTPKQIMKKIVNGDNYKFKTTDITNISIAGGWWGNVKYLDNFSIYGFKNGSNCGNLSVENINQEEFKLYPNPASKYLLFNKNVDSVHIFNSSGQNIKEIIKPNGRIDISNLVNGIYFIKFKIGNETIVKKVIKNNHFG